MAARVIDDVLSDEYIRFASELPPGSKTIWGIIEGDIAGLRTGRITDKEELLQCLARFFSPGVVDNVGKHLDELQYSELGVGFVLEKHFPVIGQSIIDGILLQRPASSSSPQTSEGQAVRGGGGDEGDEDGDERAFPALENVKRQKNILLPTWKTPPRGHGRRGTIRQRSKEFIRVFPVNGALFYSPFYYYGSKVSLYHGTRRLQLPSFAYNGINPPARTNEFWGGATFYTTNCVQYAFEFPLYYHLGQGGKDQVAVLEFHVDVQVLNGEVAPPGEEKFRVKWFRSTDERWQKWVAFHMLSFEEKRRLRLKKEDNEQWDIIIGPICFGGPDVSGKVEAVKLGRQPLVQAAMCSTRSQQWLQKHFARVCIEHRVDLSSSTDQ